MKKKMAVVLSVILACSMSMTAMAAPSPSIVNEPVAQVVVSGSVGAAGTAAVTPAATVVTGETSAVLPGTSFATASGKTVDSAAVALVKTPSTAEQTQAAANALASAYVSPNKMRIINATGRDELQLTDTKDNLNIVNNMSISLQTADGEIVSHNGSISVSFPLAEVLGGATLAEGETVQALYQRADGTWVAVPVVINNGAIAIALSAFSGAVEVTFVIAEGDQLSYIPAKTSPRT